MDEIEYKLNTNNSVLVVNAIDKLISSIQSKFKPAERQKFVLENEELKLLREKCSSKEVIVSLTACQGLLALVELGVLEIGHTMSTVVTLLPTTHNYSAIISTMTGLLILDLKSRLVPGQPYKCQFSLKSPQHPFITVLEKNKGAEDDVFAQMQALCTNSDFTVSSNSLELLRPVFLYLTCNPQREGSVRPWQLLLSLPKTDAQCSLLLACLSCQQICNPALIERAFSAYCAVADAAIYQRDVEYVTALLPVLARVSNELLRYWRDPRPCYRLMERCLSLDAPGLRPAAGVTLQLLASNLPRASALYLHDTFDLCLTIISKYSVCSVALSALAGQTLQWLHLPSYLTGAALKVAARILDVYREGSGGDSTLNIPNLLSNKIFQSLLHTDSHLSVIVKLHLVWERLRDDDAKLDAWFDRIESINDSVKVELLSFFYGVVMEQRRTEAVVLRVLRMVVALVDHRRDVAVELLPILLYKIANDGSPAVRLECLKALPLMAKTKENVPTIVSVLTKLKANRGVPTSLLIMLYTSLAETQVRCFPYLQEILAEPGPGRPDDLKWEVEVARILAVRRMCELRASSHGLELVSLISSTLNRCADRCGAAAACVALLSFSNKIASSHGLELVSLISSTLNRCADRAGAAAACVALQGVALLWRRAALAPHSAWRALEPKLARDTRPAVQIHICKLLAEIPPLQSPAPEFGPLASSACRRLWLYLAAGDPAVVEAACAALSKFSPEHYVLRDVPEIYRKTVKLPASYCKTPADAARKPEDVLDYVPCEVWPEVFKYTNQAALGGVVSLARRLIEREVRGYRSGVYHIDGREPATYAHLPAHSVVRGLMDAYRKQVTTPSFECSEEATLAMLEALAGDFPRPLPPLDLHFLAGVVAGGAGRGAAITLAANQGKVSPSARAIVENWIHGIQSGHVDEEDIILFYKLLPTLTRFLPPNTLRTPLERTLADAYALISHTKAKQAYSNFVMERTLSNIPTPWSKKAKTPSKDTDIPSKDPNTPSKDTNTPSKDEKDRRTGDEKDLFDSEDSLFEKQLKLIKRCLDCESIHEANRTLLSQLVEHYFPLIRDDNVAWPAYVSACCSLPCAHLERMTSPAGWWEVSGELVRKAGAVRAALAGGGGDAPLAWLNEYIDAQAQEITEQETSLCYMFPALLAADPGAPASREWLLQLMARAQLAFNESEDQSVKLYLFSVFVAVVVTWSGLWALEAEPAPAAPAPRLPPAAPALLQHTAIGSCTLQVLEWLCGSRAALGGAEGACCQRALLALRHTEPFTQNRIWTRLESHFGKDNLVEV